MCRPLLAAVVLPLVVIVGFQSAWAAYACRVDGKVRDRCCCKTERRDRTGPVAPDGAPRIAAQSCCDVTIHEQPQAPDAREAARSAVAHFDVVVPIATIAAIAPHAGRIAPSAMKARAPPRVPIFLVNHALLR